MFTSVYKEVSDEIYPYTNVLPEPAWWIDSSVFPTFEDVQTHHQVGHYESDECRITIGKKEHFDELPFRLEGGFQDATLALIQEKTSTSSCQAIHQHDKVLEFYNDDVVCTLWIDKNSSLREISI